MDGRLSFQRLAKTALAILLMATFANQSWAQSGARSSYTPSYQSRTAQPTQRHYQSQPTQRQQTQRRTVQRQQTTRQQTQRQPIQKQQTSLQGFQQVAASRQSELGLEGYCPVCVVKYGKWVIGDVNFPAEYDGKTYFFPGDQPRQTFLADPAAYTPALGGDCTVCYEKAGKRVPGNIRFSSLHTDRLFIFPSKTELDIFNNSPGEYEYTDLAANGNCIVCQVNANKSVPGAAEYTTIHNGFRYLFPSDRERQVFAASPQEFLTAAAKPMMKDDMHTAEGEMMDKMGDAKGEMMDKMGDASLQGDANGHDGMDKEAMMKETTMTFRDQHTLVSAETIQVQVRGTTACAACEFGVTPIGAPDELGLAVKSGDGKIYVIEDGHTRWPAVYKMRFDGQQVDVSGTIIKTQGNVAWVKPADLRTL